MDELKLMHEYDGAAEWCAKRNISGDWGSALPPMLSKECMEEIESDVDSFMRRVREHAYALAMTRHKCAHPDCPGFPYKASDLAHPCGTKELD